MKKVTILLTKYSDWVSELVYHIGGHGYTHASLGLGEGLETFYSFNFKGFCTETLARHRRRGVTQSCSYELSASDEAYKAIRQRIEKFQHSKAEMRYTRLGVVLCFFHIPFKWEYHYFCSQFVAETLKVTQAMSLRLRSSLYLPNTLCEELNTSWQLVRVCRNPV